jgi:hypothetical protein
MLMAGCSRSREADVAQALAAGTGTVDLPVGTLLLHRELAIPEGARNIEIRGNAAGSTLKAADDFQGRALIVSKGANGLRFTGFRIEGNRAALQTPIGLPPSDVSFARYYRNNGILIENATGVTIRNLRFTQIANFPLLVSASSGVRIESVLIEDSGSLGLAGRNNASGGILLEEGTRDFEVRHSTIRRVRGNGIWTHSNYRSPRNTNGIIAQNVIQEVARDAIQVGHATRIRVENNAGGSIGYPPELVDMAASATPVAIDTAGNVDLSSYVANRFEEIDGKCIDLDGFHDGEVRDNSCISRKSQDQYPYAHYGIVFNNSNPDAESVNVTVTGNLIDGAGYGGIFLIGSRHLLSGNRLLRLNRDRCTGDMTRPGCNYAPDQPDLLHSGIYLGSGAQRPAKTEQNRIEHNEISGFAMEHSCVAAAPGVSLARNRIEQNICIDAMRDPPQSSPGR